MYKYVHLGGNNEEKLSSDRVYFLRGVIANEPECMFMQALVDRRNLHRAQSMFKVWRDRRRRLGPQLGELEGGKKGNCD